MIAASDNNVGILILFAIIVAIAYGRRSYGGGNYTRRTRRTGKR